MESCLILLGADSITVWMLLVRLCFYSWREVISPYVWWNAAVGDSFTVSSLLICHMSNDWVEKTCLFLEMFDEGSSNIDQQVGEVQASLRSAWMHMSPRSTCLFVISSAVSRFYTLSRSVWYPSQLGNIDTIFDHFSATPARFKVTRSKSLYVYHLIMKASFFFYVYTGRWMIMSSLGGAKWPESRLPQCQSFPTHQLILEFRHQWFKEGASRLYRHHWVKEGVAVEHLCLSKYRNPSVEGESFKNQKWNELLPSRCSKIWDFTNAFSPWTVLQQLKFLSPCYIEAPRMLSYK
jgi:hypothetical protein